MLHIDHDTRQYLLELDRNFVSATPRMSEGIEKELNKTFDRIELDWDKQFKRAEIGIRSFNNKLISALSDALPARYIGRPRPIQHKFPYTVGGDLVTSYNYPEPVQVWGDNSMTITVSPEFTSDHASLTNLGEGSSRPVHWLHWADRVFGEAIELGARHSAKVPNIRDVLIGYYS